ncbi:DUF92 domain-containing protein [Paenibacillus sp. YN15]|uniref:DUF92 domain-containing protein n=1 Tax=Paenibacillus sp. YN15 TaxID=1742774 RepID=UPI0015ECC4AA|nr:DUF92 domain-containing protein [Paenibacillus sp. YN15]
MVRQNRRAAFLAIAGWVIIAAGLFHSLYYIWGFTRGWERDAWNLLQVLAGLVMAGIGYWIFRWRYRKWTGKALILLRLSQTAVVAGGLACAVLLAAIWITGRTQEPVKSDYLLILGARVKGETVTLSLKSRLDRGVEYMNRYPEAKAVLSGGQGPGEEMTEAETMRRYMVGRGIAENRLILEQYSTDTYENMWFSKEVLNEQGVDLNAVSVTVITNDFHMLRAKMLAKRAGFKVTGYSSRTPEFTVPKAYTRELAAFVKSYIFDGRAREALGGTGGTKLMGWLLGLAGSILVAAAAYWKKSLSLSGAIAAVGIGTVLYALGSLPWFGLMIGFFVSSSALTKWKRHKKEQAEHKYEKSGRRDGGQVAANGGLGALLCLLAAWQPDMWIWPAAFIGVMAAVTADTWATEIGGLSKQLPRSILTGRKVSTGTSGAVSGLGWAASLAGGLFIGALGMVLAVFVSAPGPWGAGEGAYGWAVIPAAMIAGWIASNADSLLGASLQALYRCPACGLEVEGRRHCSRNTVLIRGWRWMNNDAVNLISSAVGGGVMILLVYVIDTIGK